MRWLTLCTLLVLATAARANFLYLWWEQFSSLFSPYEEPPYTITNTFPGFQERLYQPMAWVCSEETGSDDSMMDSLFFRLYGYINGENERGEKMPMTAPVVTEFSFRSPTEKTYTMCFYIGQHYQDDPAQPNDSRIFIQHRPEIRIFTRTVGGYMHSEKDWMEEAGKLSALIQETGITVNLNHTFWAGYDPPMKFWFRRNEVWFPVSM